MAAAAQAARAAAPGPARQQRPQHTSVGTDPTEVLYWSRLTTSAVKGTLGPLPATETQAFKDVMGVLGTSVGGVLDLAFSAE